jgi:ActR/RegA family two-component response regulator
MERIGKEPPMRAGLLPADVLIVEDDLIIALDLEEIVQRFGVKATRTATTVAQALELIAAATPEFALLDIGLRDETSLAVADRLDALSVPFAFLTGYGARAMPLPRFGERPKLAKPFVAVDVEVVLKNWRAG